MMSKATEERRTMIDTATDTTANFECPDCGLTFEVHGWMQEVIEDQRLLFVSAPGMAPRCPDDIFTLLRINEPGVKYGGTLSI